MRKFSMNVLAVLAVTAFAAVATAQPASFIDLGNIGPAGTFTFDTFNSTTATGSVDTELGLYDAAGNLLDSNDDAGGPTGLQSSITATLPDGQYFLAISEFNTIFNPNFDVQGGFEAGDNATVTLSVDGVQIGSANVGENPQVAFFGVTVGNVVPEPATGTVIAICGLVGLTRRRRA